MPGDPTDHLDEKLDQLQAVKEANEQAILAQMDFDDADQLWSELRGGQEVDLTIDMADLVVLLSHLEQSIHQPSMNPLEQIHDMDLFIRLNEQHQDTLADYVRERNDALADALNETDDTGMFQ